MPDKKYTSFLRNYYLSSALYDFVFAYAIYNVLFSLRGLSVFSISLLLAWWSLTTILFEIPSGALADSWNRKYMLILAPCIKALGFVAWFFADGNFYLYALGFTFWSLGSSFVSGTTEALLYDTAVSFKKSEAYEKILGRKKFYSHLAIATSVILGGVIAQYNLDLVLLLSVIPLFGSGFFAALLSEAPKVESTGEVHYLEHVRTGARELCHNQTVTYLMVYALAISIFANLEEFDQLYYQFVHLPLWAFGLAGFIYSLCNSAGSFFAHHFKYRLWVLYIFPLVGAACLLVVWAQPTIPAIGILLLAYLITSPLSILAMGKMQHAIQSSSRATVTSFANLAKNLFGIAIVLCFGALNRFSPLPIIYLTTALILVGIALWSLNKRMRTAWGA